MQFNEIKDICKHAGRGKCPINYKNCSKDECPLIPDNCDCEDYCDKVDELRYKLRSANLALCKKTNEANALSSEVFTLKNFCEYDKSYKQPCKVFQGLNCPFEKKHSCPDSGAKRVYIPYPFDGTVSVLYKYDKNGNISHLGFYIDELVELSNKQQQINK